MFSDAGSAGPRKIVAYTRVSRVQGREGEGYISPAVQEESIQRWADYAGAKVVAVLLDEDVSGGTRADERPNLRLAFEMIEAGEADGIAVAKLNRFSRSTLGALRDLERLDELGGGFVSVEEDLDTSTPTGRFALTMLLAVATLERDNIVASWQIAKSRAVDRGAKISRTPFGYRRCENGTIEPHPHDAPIVAEAFARAARGDVDDAVTYLAEQRPDRTWTRFTTTRFLANRSYIGEVRYGDLINRDAHEAIVNRGTFEAAQPERHEGRRRRPPADYPLSGLARCAGCGERLVGGRGGKAKDGSGLRVYRCRASLAGWKGDKCTAPTNVTADRLEKYVIEEVAAALADAPPAVEVGPEGISAAEAQAALDEAETELAAFASDLTARRMLGDAYHDAMKARADAVEHARAELREIAARNAGREVLELDAEELRELAPRDLGEVLRGGLHSVVVGKGRGPLDGRVRIIAKQDNAVPA